MDRFGALRRIPILPFLLSLTLFRLYPSGIPLEYSLLIGGRGVDFSIVVFCLMFSSSTFLRRLDSLDITLLCISVLIFIQSGALLFLGAGSGIVLGVRDIFEPFRLIIIFSVFSFARGLPRVDQKAVLPVILAAIIIFFIVVAIRLSGASLLNSGVDLFFGASKDKAVFSQGIFRQTGFFINPNWGGVFLSWALAFFSIARPLSGRFSIIAVGAIFFLILLSGSRTGLFCSIFVLGFWLIFCASGFQKISAVACSSIILGFAVQNIGLDLVPYHHRELLRAILNGDGLSSVGTFGDRINIWTDFLSRYYSSSPIFGAGPAKGEVGSVMDNQYIKWIVWYGVIGLICHLLFFGSIVGSIIQRPVSSRDELNFKLFLCACFGVLVLAGVTGAFFDVTQLAFFLVLISGSFLGRFYRGPEQDNNPGYSLPESGK